MTIRTGLGDNFFLSGVSAIKERIRQTGCCIDYFFIQFENLKYFNLISESFFKKNTIKNIVIISNARVLPLALHYQKNADHVLAVFKDSCSLDEVMTELSMQIECLNDCQSKRWRGHPTLTSREVHLLNLLVTGYSISQLAVEFSIPVKTVYSRLECIKIKMRLRRLETLLLP